MAHRVHHVIGQEASGECAAGNEGNSKNDENSQDINSSFNEHCSHKLVKGNLVLFTQCGTFGNLSQPWEDQVDQITGGYRMVCVYQPWFISEWFHEKSPAARPDKKRDEGHGGSRKQPPVMSLFENLPQVIEVNVFERDP